MKSISEMTDRHLINALRRMEQNFTNDHPDGVDVGYIDDPEDIQDSGKFRNYRALADEAETRGLTWRRS